VEKVPKQNITKVGFKETKIKTMSPGLYTYFLIRIKVISNAKLR